jgi:hypothetical protein
MLKSISFIGYSLGSIVIISIVACKYFHSPKIFLLIIILTSIYYQIDTNKNNNKTYNFEETLINVSKFIIIVGILGYGVVRIIGLFFPVLIN